MGGTFFIFFILTIHILIALQIAWLQTIFVHYLTTDVRILCWSSLLCQI